MSIELGAALSHSRLNLGDGEPGTFADAPDAVGLAVGWEPILDPATPRSATAEIATITGRAAK
ncbi:MAG TPA: hypothetical protein VF337_03800 [Candidatus Limnocylindrales bacterium]